MSRLRKKVEEFFTRSSTRNFSSLFFEKKTEKLSSFFAEKKEQQFALIFLSTFYLTQFNISRHQIANLNYTLANLATFLRLQF